MSSSLERLTEPPLLTSLPEDARLTAECLPWSPLDFIRGISPSGDRAVQIASLMRDIDIGDDMRIAYPVAPDLDVAVCAERLPWDSNFFGYGVARLNGVFPLRKDGYTPDADYVPAIRALIDLARQRGIRYLFGVIDARDLPTIRALTALGFALIETRLYLHRSLRNYEYPRRFRCRPATAEDLDSLTALARSVVNPYDRFNADPSISRADTDRLMATWVRASLLAGYADVTMIHDSPTPGAVCTLKYHDDKAAVWGRSIAQFVLGMASPNTGNWFLATVSETLYHLKERGADHLFLTTQLLNRPILRLAEHLGFKSGRGEYVLRLLL